MAPAYYELIRLLGKQSCNSDLVIHKNEDVNVSDSLSVKPSPNQGRLVITC